MFISSGRSHEGKKKINNTLCLMESLIDWLNWNGKSTSYQPIQTQYNLSIHIIKARWCPINLLEHQPGPILVRLCSVHYGPSGVMVLHSNHSICTKMRRLDTHQGGLVESIINETGISEYSRYWSERTTLSFFYERKYIPLWSDPDSQNTFYQPWGSVAQSRGFTEAVLSAGASQKTVLNFF